MLQDGLGFGKGRHAGQMGVWLEGSGSVGIWAGTTHLLDFSPGGSQRARCASQLGIAANAFCSVAKRHRTLLSSRGNSKI